MGRFNRTHIAVTLVLGVVLVALVPMLLPSQHELGTMHLRDKEFEKAFEIFSEAYAAGARNLTVVMPLARLFLQKGKVDRAIRLIEELSELRAQDAEVLRMLGAYYQSAQRSADYTRTLEKLRVIAPRESDLRALGDIYNFQARYMDQMAVLQELIDRGWGNVVDVATIVHFHAANGEVERALGVFDSLKSQTKVIFDPQVMRLRLSLLLDAGKIVEALSLSRQWHETSESAPDLWEIAGLFINKGQPEAALALLETGIQGKPVLLMSRITYGALLVSAKRNQEAYDLLAADIAYATPWPEAVEVYTTAALGLGKVVEVLNILKNVKEEINEEILLSAIEAAYYAGLFQGAKALRDMMEPESLSARPVLMSRLALAVGEEDAARDWMRRAEATLNLTPAATLDLVSLLFKFDRPASAKQHLKALLGDPQLPGELLLRVASVLVDLGESVESLPTFAAFRRQRAAEVEVNAAWALVASVAGKWEDVRQWLRTLQGSKEHVATLIILYNAARGVRKFEVAVNTALMLHTADRSTTNFMRLVQAQLDAGFKDELRRTVEAEQAAFAQWPIEDATRLGTILLAAGQFKTLLLSLQPFTGRLDTHPAFLTVWSRAEMQNGQAHTTFTRLHTLSKAGRLSPSVKAVFVESALAVQQVEVAWDTARGDMASLPGWVQAGLVELLLASKKTKDAEAALAELGDEFSHSHPLLTAELALLQGRQREALLSLARVAQMPDRDVRATIKLGNLWVQAGKRQEALHLVPVLASRLDIPHALLMDLARLYLELDQVEQGANHLARVRQQRDTHLASAAWALLAVRGTQRSDAYAWIRQAPFSSADISFLHDIYFTSFEAKAFDIARDIAAKLWRLAPSSAHRLLRTQALLQVGDLPGALQAGKGLDVQDAQARQTYIAVLTAAVKAGLPGRNALITLLAEDLAKAHGSDQSRIIFDLIAFQAHDIVLPYLAKLAQTDLAWVELYWEALVKTGQEAAAREFLVQQAMHPDVPSQKRRAFAARLLARGDKEAAGLIYRELAALHGPKSEDMRQLLYIWGPRPFPADIAWLIDRAQHSTRQARVEWLAIMASVGARREITDLAKAWRAAGEVSSDVRAIAVRALHEIGAVDELHEALTDALQHENDPQALRSYMSIAWERRLSNLAYRFGTRLLAMHEADASQLKILGSIAYSRGNFAEAKALLSRYLVLDGKGDFESHFHMAEILVHEGDVLGGTDHYLTSLEQIEAAANPSLFMARLRGLIFQRLRRYDEAIVVFEQLLEENPNHQGLNSDLAETLLLQRAPAQAHTATHSGRRR
jgi:tetratricopeptide (TPR) repeat protein